MELKIVDPTAKSLHSAIGISDERADILGEKIQELHSEFNIGTYTKEIAWQRIAAFCETLEEFALCLGAWESYHAIKLI